LQGGIAHPDMSEVIPFMPEQISNEDGYDKQDCEINAGKRLIKKWRIQHPQLGLTIGGEALFAAQSFIEDISVQSMNYIFMVKPDKHTYLFDWISAHKTLNKIEFIDDKKRRHIYEWMNNVPLNGREDAINVNFIQCTIIDYNDYKLSLLPKRPLKIGKRGTVLLYKTDNGYKTEVTNRQGVSKEIELS